MSELDSVAESETALCPGCMTTIPPHAKFCEKCGMPLSSAATTLPLEYTRSMGELVRRGYERPKLISVIGVWLIFGPPCLIMLVLIVAYPRREPVTWTTLPSAIGSILFTLFVFSLPVSILWRTTGRYLATAPASTSNEVDDDGKSETPDFDSTGGNRSDDT